jgi:hypothetical protein
MYHEVHLLADKSAVLAVKRTKRQYARQQAPSPNQVKSLVAVSNNREAACP